MQSLLRWRALEHPAPSRLQASLLVLPLLWVLTHLWSAPRVLQAWCQGLDHQVANFLLSCSHTKLDRCTLAAACLCIYQPDFVIFDIPVSFTCGCVSNNRCAPAQVTTQ